MKFFIVVVILGLVSCIAFSSNPEDELEIKIRAQRANFDNAMAQQNQSHINRIAETMRRLASDNFHILVKWTKVPEIDKRISAAFALSFSDRTESAQLLLEMMDDQDPGVQGFAIANAGIFYYYGNPDIKKKALPILKSKLVNARSNAVRKGAAFALFCMLEEEDVPACKDVLIKALSDQDLVVRNEVIRSIGKLKLKEAEEKLIYYAFEDEIIKSPSSLFPGRVSEEIACIIKIIHINASIALGEIGSESAIPYLIGLLASDDKDVIESAHLALRKITGQNIGYFQQDWKSWYNRYLEEKNKEKKDAPK